MTRSESTDTLFSPIDVFGGGLGAVTTIGERRGLVSLHGCGKVRGRDGQADGQPGQ